MAHEEPRPHLLIEQARQGNAAARGALLELYRNYLRLVARSLIGGALRSRLAASDLVQETFLKAHRDFEQFGGMSERELLAWLRQVLVRSLSNQVKHHRRLSRDHHRQVSLEQLLDQSSLAVQQALASRFPSPRRAGRSGSLELIHEPDDPVRFVMAGVADLLSEGAPCHDLVTGRSQLERSADHEGPGQSPM